MDTYDSITRRYVAPRGKDLVIYFLPETSMAATSQSPHLSLVVNKPSRPRLRGLRG